MINTDKEALATVQDCNCYAIILSIDRIETLYLDQNQDCGILTNHVGKVFSRITDSRTTEERLFLKGESEYRSKPSPVS